MSDFERSAAVVELCAENMLTAVVPIYTATTDGKLIRHLVTIASGGTITDAMGNRQMVVVIGGTRPGGTHWSSRPHVMIRLRPLDEGKAPAGHEPADLEAAAFVLGEDGVPVNEIGVVGTWTDAPAEVMDVELVEAEQNLDRIRQRKRSGCEKTKTGFSLENLYPDELLGKEESNPKKPRLYYAVDADQFDAATSRIDPCEQPSPDCGGDPKDPPAEGVGLYNE